MRFIGWYRIILPFDQLKAHGWDTGYGITMPPTDPGVVVGERFDQPDVLPIWGGMRKTGLFGMVYEIDDDPFSLDRVNWLAYPTYGRDEVLDTIAECARIADVVTVTTEPLAEVMRRYNPEVRVLPNCIPAYLLGVDRRRHNNRVTIGWGGGVSHMRDMAMIAQAWRDVVDETGARGHFVGADYRNMVRPDGFDFTAWVPSTGAYYQQLDFDIGLAPIADHPFGRSKSHLKALEYAALGIPCIASDCEAYRDFVIDGVTGFLVSTRDEWKGAMMLLARDEGLRTEMGRKARELAAQHTIEGNWHRWNAVYEQLL